MVLLLLLLLLLLLPQAEDARRRRRVADLHVQRNVVAVLGLLHCPLVEDLSAAHSEFQRTARWGNRESDGWLVGRMA
jgi:hypothetical protein